MKLAFVRPDHTLYTYEQLVADNCECVYTGKDKPVGFPVDKVEGRLRIIEHRLGRLENATKDIQ